MKQVFTNPMILDDQKLAKMLPSTIFPGPTTHWLLPWTGALTFQSPSFPLRTWGQEEQPPPRNEQRAEPSVARGESKSSVNTGFIFIFEARLLLPVGWALPQWQGWGLSIRR